jgi:hypothetical protein
MKIPAQKIPRAVKHQPETENSNLPTPQTLPTISPDSPINRDNILTWQRTIGNHAVKRMIARSKPPQPVNREAESDRLVAYSRVQRYSQEGDPLINPSWRTSMNGKIVQVSEQEVYASRETIAEASSKLKAANSYIDVAGVSDAPWGGKLEFYQRVKLIFNAAGSRDEDYAVVNKLMSQTPEERHEYLKKTSRMYVENLGLVIADIEESSEPGKEKAKAQKDEALSKQKKELDVLLKLDNVHESELFVTPRDCEKTAGMVMGANRKGTDPYLIINSLKTGAPEKIKLSSAFRDRDTSTAAQAQNMLLKTALPQFLEWMQKNDKVETHKELVVKLKEFGNPTSSTYNYGVAMAAYEMIQKSDLAATFNELFGINEFLRPEVGQALTMVNDEREKRKADADIHSPKELWNFHWAGVVLTDGSDYLTLQALADQDQNRITITWYYKMYGSGKQSFHSEEKNDPHTGSRPMSLGVAYKGK